MKMLTAVLVASLAFAASAASLRADDAPSPRGNELRIDSRASKALFKIGHLYLTEVDGTVPILSGTVTLAPGSAIPTRVDAVLDPRGVKTGDDERDADLQGGDWFETSRFPTWTYTGTGVVPEGPGRFSVAGALRVHGVAQPVALEVNVVRGLPNPLYHAVGHASRHGFAMTVTRTDALVGDDVTIELDVSLAP
jgi:polyisoprenoid-binding protein YceI